MDLYKSAIEKNRFLIEDAFDFLWAHPETGYKEWETHKYLKNIFESLGYDLTEAGNIPGFCAEADTGLPGPTLLVFAEMDALVIPSHPEADPKTGAVHACGHCAQTAAIVGVAAAIKEDGILNGLSGKIRFVIVPADEANSEVQMKFNIDMLVNEFGVALESITH